MVVEERALVAAGGWCAPSEVIYGKALDSSPWWPRVMPRDWARDRERSFRRAVEDEWLASQWRLVSGHIYPDLEPGLLDLPTVATQRGGLQFS